ncbi:MAG: hypothetical protein KKD86_04135 [Bacteroidetes bacterium]|nr:hypothetical protein [Bacteroidota bacterium]
MKPINLILIRWQFTKKKVFEKYQVTEQNYVEAINLLGEDDEKWEMFFQKSLAYLETLRERDKIN